MFWTGWGTFFRIVAGYGYARNARRVRESEWLGEDEVLVVKVPHETAMKREDTRTRWWSRTLSSATHRAHATSGTKASRLLILDVNTLPYDVETLPDPVDLGTNELECPPETIIGVLILRHVPASSKVSRKSRCRGGRAWIRGWAVSRAAPVPSVISALHLRFLHFTNLTSLHDFRRVSIQIYSTAQSLTPASRSPQPAATSAPAPPFLLPLPLHA